ncbi:hypothetical protein BGZ83_007785 [Gryganskiella cystojenkinii]|nr:hypothetical protein BGZ83_007785 [Gryganskiella cystojenkinii]
MAKHEGYDLERPTEFFRKYGPYILGMLRMIKHGVSVAGYVCPPLAHLRLGDKLDLIHDNIGSALESNNLEPQVDSAIQYLERLRHQVHTTTSNPINGLDYADQVQALEGAELRQVASFLKGSDEAMVLGNLYRITTTEGHVKWVCLDHYRENYNAMALKAFADNVHLNNGQYDEHMGTVKVSLKSSSSAKEFYGLLIRARNVQELDLTLDWNTTYSDLKLLRDSLQAVNVSKLSLDCKNSTGPTTDTFNRGKRGDPLVQILMNTKTVSVRFTRCDGFFSRSSAFIAKPTPLREVHIDSFCNPNLDEKKLQVLLEQSPRLSMLSLVCQPLNFPVAVKVVQTHTLCHRLFRILQISASLGVSGDSQAHQKFSKESTYEHERLHQKQYPRGLHSSVAVFSNVVPGSQLQVYSVDDKFLEAYSNLCQTFVRSANFSNERKDQEQQQWRLEPNQQREHEQITLGTFGGHFKTFNLSLKRCMNVNRRTASLLSRSFQDHVDLEGCQFSSFCFVRSKVPLPNPMAGLMILGPGDAQAVYDSSLELDMLLTPPRNYERTQGNA